MLYSVEKWQTVPVALVRKHHYNPLNTILLAGGIVMLFNDLVRVGVEGEQSGGELIYCLLTDTEIIEGECIAVYGVSIAYKTEGDIQMEKIHNVTSNKGEMVNLMEKMQFGHVFPVTLIDIVEDFIA